jgi:hypothetical protein
LFLKIRETGQDQSIGFKLFQYTESGIRVLEELKSDPGEFHEYETWKILNKFIVLIHMNTACMPAYGHKTACKLFCKAGGQGCRERLPGKADGQGCRARLTGKAAGQGCRAKVQTMVQYAESMVKLDNKRESHNSEK